MKTRSIHFSLTLLVALTALPLSAGYTRAQAADVITDPEAYLVYRSILPIAFSSEDRDLSRIALLQETRSKTNCQRPERVDPQWRSAWDSYDKENARVRTFLPELDLGLPYVLVPLAEVTALLVRAGNDGKTIRGGWPDAYTSFPNGKVLAFSAVGFDETKTHAIVAAQYNCGLSRDPQNLEYDCHGGQHIPLVKNQGRWVRANIASCGWIA